MIVKELIADLQKSFKPEDEIFVEYWDKDIVEAYGTARPLTVDEWVTVVDRMESGEFYYQSKAAQTLVEVADDVIEEAIA